MNQSSVDKIVNAVLYEGYILYPYRPGSKKNQQRFSFGRVYPEAYSIAQDGAEPCMMQTECLLLTQADSSAIRVKVRFLHPLSREVGKFLTPAPGLFEGEEIPAYEIIPGLSTGGKLYQSWQEVTERDVDTDLLPVALLAESPWEALFSFPPSCEMELIRDEHGHTAGVLVRRQEAVEGLVEITATQVGPHAFKISVRIFNRTPVEKDKLGNQDAVVMRTFASTHTILNVEGGEFISLTDPPAGYAEMAASCKNIGAWPVLLGDEKKGERDTVLSSPIILYDYPQIAPESPGDLHDGTEIDEILTLRIMTMTDEEKHEMRNVDAHARRILERTESLQGEDFLKMHGVMRDVQPFGEDFFNPSSRVKLVRVAGVDLKTGDQVRIRPKGRADAMDLALAGRIAVIEAIEEDAEGHVHFALVLEDDPGKDLGMLRQPGHRFFYRLDEVEPVEAMKS
jgi:hypothetical protein